MNFILVVKVIIVCNISIKRLNCKIYLHTISLQYILTLIIQIGQNQPPSFCKTSFNYLAVY